MMRLLLKWEISSSVVDLDNKDWRIYTLANDKDHHFLMEYLDDGIDGIDLMPPPVMFLRAMDTKGKNIEIPRFIDDLDYEYWNNK